MERVAKESDQDEVPVDLGWLTDDGNKDDLKGGKGVDLLIGGIGDKLKP
ncbi:MAG: hypothetical protein H8E44_05045 [Planctomycetes bacterium]|nr:hypothetical protein [Planctomycetota bacterium]MBL7039482.1 hypothetical protein [Pirellulaceae bacterium]